MKSKYYSVIIPSAKSVPLEMQKIGKLPPVIYPIGNSIVFDLLRKQYESAKDIIILVGEDKEKVYQMVNEDKACEDNKSIKIIDIPLYADLGRTIQYGLNKTVYPIIINFADTIVDDLSIDEDSDDIIYYSKGFYSKKWTYFDVNENGIIDRIFDKSEKYFEGEKKIFVGVFKISHPKVLDEILENNSKIKGENIFYKSIQQYSEMYKFKFIETRKWNDIGHIENYSQSKLAVQAREFNSIEIDDNRGILKKTSTQKTKLINEILWYLKLPSDLEYVRPRIFAYSLSYKSPFVSMEYYAYHTLHELFLYGDLSKQQWVRIFEKIKFICSDFNKYVVEDEAAINKSMKDVYLFKTIERIEQLRNNSLFDNFFEKNIIVNGSKFLSLNCIEKKLYDCVPRILLNRKKFNIIHGDLCFSNILIDDTLSFIKLIDPRGNFGEFDIYGDQRYEIAKMYHSIDGKYDYVIKDLFKIYFNTDEPTIKFEIQKKLIHDQIKSVFELCFEDYFNSNKNEIVTIESLLFLSMIPLHKENIKHQMAFLAIGLSLLNSVINITV